MNQWLFAIVVALAATALIFALAMVISACIGRIDRAEPKYNPKERERIEAHRNKRTLIIPEGTPAEDKTQVQYFATGKGFVHGDNV